MGLRRLLRLRSRGIGSRSPEYVDGVFNPELLHTVFRERRKLRFLVLRRWLCVSWSPRRIVCLLILLYRSPGEERDLIAIDCVLLPTKQTLPNKRNKLVQAFDRTSICIKRTALQNPSSNPNTNPNHRSALHSHRLYLDLYIDFLYTIHSLDIGE
jgi:hypothetical protein